MTLWETSIDIVNFLIFEIPFHTSTCFPEKVQALLFCWREYLLASLRAVEENIDYFFLCFSLNGTFYSYLLYEYDIVKKFHPKCKG